MLVNLNDLISKKESLSVIGLGYVGLPLAVEFSKKINVIGIDTNHHKIDNYIKGNDLTDEVGNDVLARSSVLFTSDAKELLRAKFHIIAVPTPINVDKTPNLEPVVNASKMLGENLTKGSVVVYESTVYPGVTEDVCIPILEEYSGLKCGIDFKVGYSPERINPGDKVNRLTNIVKIVSGIDETALELISNVYNIIIEAGTFKASSIKVAEATKVVENSQRDINIAFMNELAIAFDMMGIDSFEVIKAMNTKWNSLGFYPGLVGGHCIGVDPYYFIYEAEKLGYHSQIIQAGRRINDDMGKYVAESIIKKMVNSGKLIKGAKILILGFTFKENTRDSRNTKIIDIVNKLKEYSVESVIVDPVADKDDVKKYYNIDLMDINDVHDIEGILYAVPHNEFQKYDLTTFDKLFKDDKKLIFDLRGRFEIEDLELNNYDYWRL